jgi:hypothetical protein
MSPSPLLFYVILLISAQFFPVFRGYLDRAVYSFSLQIPASTTSILEQAHQETTAIPADI